MDSKFLSRFVEKHSLNLEFSDSLSMLASSSVCDFSMRKRLLSLSNSISDCGTFLTFARNLSSSDDNVLLSANFCKQRLCPTCSWRRSYKVFSQMMTALSAFSDKKLLDSAGVDSSIDYKFLFCTLTIRNCSIDELNDYITLLLESYTMRFMKYKICKKAFLGHYRALEVTYNSLNNTFHPHLHCVFAVSSGYFKKDYYISNDRLRELWKKALGVDYLPLTNIKKINGFDSDSFDSVASAVCEVTKYTTKAIEYIDFTDIENTCNMLYALDSSLYNRRLYSFCGIFKKILSFLRLDNDDICKDDTQFSDFAKYAVVSYAWNSGFQNYSYVDSSRSTYKAYCDTAKRNKELNHLFKILHMSLFGTSSYKEISSLISDYMKSSI